MSGDWRAIVRLLGLAALGLVVVGLIVQTIADASIRKRERTTIVGAGLVTAGFLATSALLTASDDDAVAAVGSLVASALVLPAALVPSRLTAWLTYVSLAVSIALQIRKAWLTREMGDLLWMTGAAVGLLGVMAVGSWIYRRFSKPEPGRRAHA